MNRRTFFKTTAALTAAVAVPLKALAAELPTPWKASQVRWMSAYDIYKDIYCHRADIFIGKCKEETATKLTLEWPEQYGVYFLSTNKQPSEVEKADAMQRLMSDVRGRLSVLNAA